MFLELFRRPGIVGNFPRATDGCCRRRFDSAFSFRCRRSWRRDLPQPRARRPRARYEDGARPAEVLAEIFALWTTRRRRRLDLRDADRAQPAGRGASELERRRAAGEPLPLFGVPFAVKDNIDVAGLPTTAACPAFAYTPEAGRAGRGPAPRRRRALRRQDQPRPVRHRPRRRALAVRRCRATPSTRATSPAARARARRSRWPPGSSSFALGTDTAGSGRVPAAFNNIVGLKPTRGVLSTTGVVPACRSLDCVSIFALTVDDAAAVAELARGYDESDPGRAPDAGTFASRRPIAPPRFRFGGPAGAALDFLGDAPPRSCSSARSRRSRRSGGERVDVDFAPFREAGGAALRRRRSWPSG